MSRPFGDDDPCDRPEYFYIDEVIQERMVEENVERADEKANEMHDISDLF